MLVLLFSTLHKWLLSHMLLDVITSERINAAWKALFLHLRNFSAIYSEEGDSCMMRILKEKNHELTEELAMIAYFGFRRIDTSPESTDQYPYFKARTEYCNYLLNQCTTP